MWQSGITITPSTQVEEHGKNLFDIVSSQGEEETEAPAPKPTPTGWPDGDDIMKEIQKLEDKRVQKGLRWIPEEEQEFREKVIRELISGICKGTITTIEAGVNEIIMKYNCSNQKEDLLFIWEKFYNDSLELIKQWEQRVAQLEQEVAQLDADILKILQETEQEITSLKTKYEGKSPDEINRECWKKLQEAVDLFVKRSYHCKPELVARFHRLGIDTKLLKEIASTK